MSAKSEAERRAFLETHTVFEPVPLVPELRTRVASDVTPLWHATEAWLAERAIEPPFWAFPWAGGQALARYVLDHPMVVAERSVIDFASGSGLVGLAAARAGAREVRCLDADPLAEVSARLNARENELVVHAETCDPVGSSYPPGTVLLAGDVFYDAHLVARFVPWFRALAASGVRVIAGDPGRAYVPTEGVRVLFETRVPVPEALEGKLTLAARVLDVLA